MILFDSLLGHGTDRKGTTPSQLTIMLVQGTGGIIAGATASCVTTPLDTIKTRLQVLFKLFNIKLSSPFDFYFCFFLVH